MKQRLKRIARLFLPPIVIITLKKLRSVAQQEPDWEYIPEGWVQALTHTGIKGWNQTEVLESYLGKRENFREVIRGAKPLGVAYEATSITNENYSVHNTFMAYGYVLARTCAGCDRLSILDWGGSLGHYRLLSEALLPDVQFDYFCQEMPIIAEYGQAHVPGITFFSDDSYQHRTYDLVLSSSSLHYSENWRELFKNLAQVTEKSLYITRIPIVSNVPSFVVLQRAYRYNYNTEYLGWFLNRDEFLTYASEIGMNLIREFLIEEEPPVDNAPEQGRYRGFLFQRML